MGEETARPPPPPGTGNPAPFPPHPYDAELISCLPPSLLGPPRKFQYDATRFDFSTVIRDIICPDDVDDVLPLSSIHLTPSGLGHVDQKISGHSGRNFFNRRWRSRERQNPSSSADFRRILGLFCKEVLTPLLGLSPGDLVVYQRSPTLRVHFHGQQALGSRHRDYGYKRQPTEINCWLPLTPCLPSNALWSESAPGLGDFSPFVTSGAGEFYLFHGSQVRWSVFCRLQTCASASASVSNVKKHPPLSRPHVRSLRSSSTTPSRTPPASPACLSTSG